MIGLRYIEISSYVHLGFAVNIALSLDIRSYDKLFAGKCLIARSPNAL